MTATHLPQRFTASLPFAVARLTLLLALATAAVFAPPARAAEQDAAIEQRIAGAAQYLASDELEGRGLGSKGLDLAADYIGRQFADARLKTDLYDGTAMQKFAPPSALRTGSDNVFDWLLNAALGKPIEAKNVIGILEGEGPTADETIVIGAHYDHLGIRGRRPAAPSQGAKPPAETAKPQEPTIYNGADDNASGVAVLIEVARTLANRPEKLRRRVVFVAFTGEERGLLGSAYYVSHPLFPVEKTAAMLNLDMVGRLRNDQLSVYGTGTSSSFSDLLDRINEKHGLSLAKKPSGFGPSDHSSFYSRKIPVLHFFTDSHENVHRPSDDFETLNVPGMRRVAGLVTDVAVSLANADKRPEYVATGRPPGRRGAARPFFGSIGNLDSKQPGYAISDVVSGGPAERAGIRAGDVIVQLNDAKIAGFDQFTEVLEKHKRGDRVKVVVRRGEETLSVEVTLDPAR